MYGLKYRYKITFKDGSHVYAWSNQELTKQEESK